MKEREEDILITLYLTKESEHGFSSADIMKARKILKLIKKVREEMKKEGA